jgi:cell division protein FtsQ
MTLRPLLRRFKSDLWGRLRTVFLAVVTVGGGASLAYAVYFQIGPAVLDHPYFQLASIRIRCDDDALSPDKIAYRAGLFAGTSLWRLDTDSAEQALREPAWVADARVTRHFPNRVLVEVRERHPVAATPTSGGTFLIDDAGVVYRPESGAEYPDVPYLTGWQGADDASERMLRLRTLLTVARAAEARDIRVSQVDLDAHGELWLFPEGRRVAVRLGRQEGLRRKLQRLDTVLDRLPADDGSLQEIDASYSDRVVLRASTGQYGRVLTALADAASGRRGGGDRG